MGLTTFHIGVWIIKGGRSSPEEKEYSDLGVLKTEENVVVVLVLHELGRWRCYSEATCMLNEKTQIGGLDFC